MEAEPAEVSWYLSLGDLLLATRNPLGQPCAGQWPDSRSCPHGATVHWRKQVSIKRPRDTRTVPAGTEGHSEMARYGAVGGSRRGQLGAQAKCTVYEGTEGRVVPSGLSR